MILDFSWTGVCHRFERMGLEIFQEMTDSATIRLENDCLRVEVAPAVGGRIVSLLHKPAGQEWLWRNPALPLRRVAPGTAYDPEFYGGIDEQIPCDGPETLDGIAYPDHGELSTQALEASTDGDALVLRGELPLLGFRYERRMELAPNAPELRVKYRITNVGSTPRSAFLWKLHAALAVAAGDRILCPATHAQPLDLAWSRCRESAPFEWPHYGEVDMSLVPPPDGTAEFLALTGLAAGTIRLRAPRRGRNCGWNSIRPCSPAAGCSPATANCWGIIPWCSNPPPTRL